MSTDLYEQYKCISSFAKRQKKLVNFPLKILIESDLKAVQFFNNLKDIFEISY